MDVCNAGKKILLFLIGEVAEISQISGGVAGVPEESQLKERLALMQKKVHNIEGALRQKSALGESAEERKLSAIMHDIRGIMSAITGNVGIAALTKEQEKLQLALERVCEASVLVSQAIEENIILIDSVCAKPIIAKDSVRVGQQVFQALLQTALKISQDRRGGEERVNVFLNIPSEPIIVSACGSYCTRVLMNLFNNAFDAIAVKEYPKKNQTIWIFAHADNSILEVQVRDNGIGMEASIMQQIFQKHFSTKGKKGEGIGLYFCKKVVEEDFGGSLLVESFPGGGTTFRIRIPLHKLVA